MVCNSDSLIQRQQHVLLRSHCYDFFNTAFGKIGSLFPVQIVTRELILSGFSLYNPFGFPPCFFPIAGNIGFGKEKSRLVRG